MLIQTTPRNTIDIHMVLSSRIVEAQLIGFLDVQVSWTVQAHAGGFIIIGMLKLRRRVAIFPLSFLLDRPLLARLATNNFLHRLSEIIEFIPGGLHGMLFEYLLVVDVRVHVANVINSLLGTSL